MRYFLDTEFWEQGAHEPIRLISIALLAEDGRMCYREVAGAWLWTESEWLQEHVIPHLLRDEHEMSPFEIAHDVLHFVGDDPSPEFWGYYSDYDWVVFCQLFGDMGSLPKGWPYYCSDLRQSLDERGLTHIKQPDDAQHIAYGDAQWVARTWREYIEGR